MHKIRERLFIASGEEAIDKQLLKMHNIDAIVNCTKEWPNLYEKNEELKIDYLRVPIDDPDPAYEEHIDRAVTWIKEKIDQRKNVMVHCVAGRSRSCAVILSYLSYSGMNLGEAWNHMQSINPEFVFRDTFRQILEAKLKELPSK